MKKKLFFAFIFSSYVSISSAQNTYPYPSSGNVGIGTTNPTTTLSVLGNGYSSLPGYRSMADFYSTNTERARISVVNGGIYSNHNKSSAIIFGLANYTGSGLVPSWELGIDIYDNGVNSFYFLNNANGPIPFCVRENSNIGVQSPTATFQVEDDSLKLANGEVAVKGTVYA